MLAVNIRCNTTKCLRGKSLVYQSAIPFHIGWCKYSENHTAISYSTNHLFLQNDSITRNIVVILVDRIAAAADNQFRPPCYLTCCVRGGSMKYL